MKKRITEPGLDYIRSLGFKPAKTMSGVVDQITEASDRDKAQALLKAIGEYTDKKTNDSSFYRIKNSDYYASLALTSAYDADILRKACNWISSHAQYFGNSILEVGCDCGVISCFLAKTFPDAKIVAIDRCAEAIENAKLLAEKQGAKNVIFKVCNLKDIGEPFDTIFSMRTMHENFVADEDYVNDLSEQAEIFKESLSDYAVVLSRCLSDQGKLVSIERVGRNALLLGWMEALEAVDLLFDLSCYEELKCVEVGKESVFQAFICFKGIGREVGAKNLFHFACAEYLDYSQAQYKGWDAKIIYEYRRETLIEGYNLVFLNPSVKGRIAVWIHKTDETGLIFYQNINGDVTTSFYDISQKEELLASMRGFLDEQYKSGNVIITKMS